MRVDHLAYQRALHISAFGFIVQALVGAVLLVFGLAVDDTPSVFAAMWCLLGLIPWIGLLVVFAQHRLERLESLEEDELSGSGAAALFDRSGEAVRPAARRLRLAYKWILPGFSVAFSAGLAGMGWLALRLLDSEDSLGLTLTDHRGWMEAIVLAGAAITFVFSRYLAGMAAQDAWKQLRAGAGQMAGTAVVLGALAVGVGLRFFDVDGVVDAVAWTLPFLMFAAALEVVLSIVLDAYRPRRAGEFPRPSFDSPTLSLLAQPGSVVRSINDAVNYQFGFDITSSWGYQLLLRSSLGLGGLALLVLMLMSTVVVVGPREQGLRLRSGAIVSDAVHDSGPFVKWPWPVESAEVFDVTQVRDLAATPIPVEEPLYYDWREPPKLTELHVPPYITQPSSLGSVDTTQGDDFALVVPDVRLSWRVKQDELLNWLTFVADERQPRQSHTQQQLALELIAQAEMTRLFAQMQLDEVLSTERNALGAMLKDRIQTRLEAVDAGIELVAVEVPEMRPPEDVAMRFESLPVAMQQREQWISMARRDEVSKFTSVVGDVHLVDDVLSAIKVVDDAQDHLVDVRREKGENAPETVQAREAVQQASDAAVALLQQGGGQAWQAIADAQRDFWVNLMQQRAERSRVQGQEASWVAAPNLYRQRKIMQVYARMLPGLRKYIVGLDSDRLNVNIELREHASPNTVFSDMVSAPSEGAEESN